MRALWLEVPEKGTVRSLVLSVAFTPVPGPRLQVTWGEGEASI